jgi:hypothetical protein
VPVDPDDVLVSEIARHEVDWSVAAADACNVLGAELFSVDQRKRQPVQKVSLALVHTGDLLIGIQLWGLNLRQQCQLKYMLIFTPEIIYRILKVSDIT